MSGLFGCESAAVYFVLRINLSESLWVIFQALVKLAVGN